MQKDNAVLRKLNAVGSNACRGALIAAMTVSMLPTSAFAAAATTETGSEATNNAPISATSEETKSLSNKYSLTSANGTAVQSGIYDLTKIADGTYKGTAQVAENGDEENDDEFAGYTVTVNVTVSDHKITKVDVARDEPSESSKYMNKAVEGTKKATSVPAAIVNAQGTDVDSVSGATYSSVAIKAATDNALQTAYDDQNASKPVESEYTYGFAAVPWTEYWNAEGVYNATDASSSDEKDSHGEYDKGGFDVVTRATLNHGIKRVSFQSAMTIQTAEGKIFKVASWAQDQSTFTTADGETCTWAQNGNKGATITDASGATYTFKDFSIYGTKYVPVKVKTADLDAFKAAYTFYANDSEIQVGVNGEGNMKPYAATAEVTDETNGLKEVTKSGDSFIFGAAKTGTESGLKDQALKSVNLSELGPMVYSSDELGNFGEMMRVDFKGAGYGELGANMQSVTWTYYGNDATRTNAVRTFGTKFEADNWMHSKIGIQLGLTDSARCEFPEGYDGTGYWTVTIHALGYTDSSYNFEATADNIKKAATPVTEETRAALQAAYDKAAALNEADYTAETWEKFVIERDEAKELLAKVDLGESEAAQQAKDLQAAIAALVSLYPQAGSYVLMNIPYADLYAADTTNNSTKVDVFTSATVSKSQTGRLSGGSYGGITNVTESNGKKTTKISGAQFPVKVSAEAAEKLDWSKFTQVTDSTTQDVTTTNRGQTSTTTYTGKQALFCMGDYAYYQLSEEPSFYKELTVDADGNLQLSEVKYAEGAQATEVSAKSEFKTDTAYGDYQLDLDSATIEQYFDHETDFIYTVLINAEDENGTQYSYGLRPLENVWLGNELAWCSTPLVSQVHGCPTSYEHYASLMGKTIKSVTYYTEKGAYTFGIDDTYVPVKDADASIKAEDASLDGGNTTVTAEANLPKGFEAQYQIDGADVTPTEKGSKLVFDVAGLKPGAHTLTVKDATGKYADISSSFKLTTAKLVARFDAANLKLIIADNGASDDELANFVKNITKVTVNGTEYAATGRGAVKIFNADGTLNLAAAKQDKSLVFDAYGDYRIEIEATGYSNNLDFTYSKSADKTQLEAAVSAASKLSNDDGSYTAASWKAFQDALANAQSVNETVTATDEEVANALSTLQTAQAALAKAATADDLSDLKVEIGRADALTESDYTADSWKAYQQALAAAQDVLTKEDASQAEVQAATQTLAAARKALAKPGQSGNGTNNGSGNGNGSNSGNGTGSNSGNGNATGSNAKKNSKGSSDTLANTGDTQLAATGIVAGIGAAIVAAGAALRRRMQH